MALGEAELVETKTSKADRYAALELEDPAEKTAKSRLVRLTGAKGNTIAEVVIGKQRPEGYGTGQGGGTYVRKPGDPQTWLANVELDASVAVKDWVKTSVLSLDADKISRISIEIPGEQALKIERPAPPAPKDKDAKDAKDDAKDAKDAKETKETKEPSSAAPAKLAFRRLPARGQEAEGCRGGRNPRARRRLHRPGGRAQARRAAGGRGRQHRQDRDAPTVRRRRCACARTATRTGCPSP